MNPITAPPARQKTFCSLAALVVRYKCTFSVLGEKRALLSLSMYVALTYIPGGGLLTGFAIFAPASAE